MTNYTKLVIKKKLPSILTDIGISLDDPVTERIYVREIGPNAYQSEKMGGILLRHTARINLGIAELYSNPLMRFKPIANRFVLFNLAKQLYVYWAELNHVLHSSDLQQVAEHYAERWVAINA